MPRPCGGLVAFTGSSISIGTGTEASQILRMPRLYFSMREGDKVEFDPERSELSSQGDAVADARKATRVASSPANRLLQQA